MPVEVSFGKLDSAKEQVKAPPPDQPFRVIVLGDFSGRASRGETGSALDIAGRRMYKVTRENFDDILGKLAVQLQLPGVAEGETHELKLTALDDFEPDSIYDKIDRFKDLDTDEQSQLMSVLLHHADFQAVESAWRGLDWLLRRLPSSTVQVSLLDVTQDEFISDIAGPEDLKQTGLYQVLVEKPAARVEGAPWALFVGLYTFTVGAEHANILGRLAKIAREAAAPFLTAVAAAVAEPAWELAEEEAKAWEALRQLPEAAMLGLALPRFLLRLPYGANTRSIDRFSFEELTDPAHRTATLLWGNPALGCAALLGKSFAKDGWALKPGGIMELTDMALYVYTDEDDERVGMAVEAFLARQEGEKLAPLGLMHFAGVRGRDMIQLLRFQSVAEPPKGQPLVDLLGQWGQQGAVKLPPSSAKPPVSVGVSLMGKEGPAAAAPARPAPAAKPAAKVAPAPKEEAPPTEEEPAAAPADSGSESEAPAAAEQPAETAAASDDLDPELAALMKQLGGDSSGASAATTPAADAKPADTPAAAGGDDMDPELAALMKQLEGGDSGAAAPAPAADVKPAADAKPAETPAPTAAEEEMDPELAALMKQLEGGGAAGADGKAAEPAAEQEIDPELAALMKQLEG